MVDLTVYNRKGQEVDSLKVDESILGGSVRYPLLKAATKSRGMVAGSTAKVFRQKGTGRARIGNIRTGKRVGGGATFGKVTRDFSKRMPKKQRKLARDSAVLAKLLNGDVVVIDELDFEKPRTADFAGILDNLRIDRSCLVTTSDYNENLCKSARNVPRIAIMPVAELNAGDICNYRKMLFTKEAFMTFLGRSEDSESQ
ncbi:MAG: 50S ribosomal protein L4 [Planctomycetota bacterium]|jgi:large subunit ribosomal protein L4